jgi:hypothetical protein
LDDDDDGDEMIGASLEEDLPSHKGKPTTGERQTTHHLLFPNDNNALSSSSFNAGFPQ